MSNGVQTSDGPLVTGDWLREHLGNQRVQVLDVRGRHPSSPLPHAKRIEYAAGHIPGAVFVDWEHDFIDAEDPVPVQIAGAEVFARRAGELGISEGDIVVAYDDYYGIFAARTAWAFRYYGAEARVLDGGWMTWLEEGRPVSERAVERHPTRFTARPCPRLRRTLAEVQEAQARGAARAQPVDTFCLVHGAWHDDACWELLVAELERRDHECVTPVLPLEDRTSPRRSFTHATTSYSMLDT